MFTWPTKYGCCWGVGCLDITGTRPVGHLCHVNEKEVKSIQVILKKAPYVLPLNSLVRRPLVLLSKRHIFSCQRRHPPTTPPHRTTQTCDFHEENCTQGAGFSFTVRLTLASYAVRSFLYRLYASACAGESGFGSSSRSCTPRRICLIVMAGFHPSSSFRMDKQTVPDG